MAHLFIINPLSGHGADNLFSTHPATRNRIAQFTELARKAGPKNNIATRATAPAAVQQTGPAGPWGARPEQPKRGPWG